MNNRPHALIVLIFYVLIPIYTIFLQIESWHYDDALKESNNILNIEYKIEKNLYDAYMHINKLYAIEDKINESLVGDRKGLSELLDERDNLQEDFKNQVRAEQFILLKKQREKTKKNLNYLTIKEK